MNCRSCRPAGNTSIGGEGPSGHEFIRLGESTNPAIPRRQEPGRPFAVSCLDDAVARDASLRAGIAGVDDELRVVHDEAVINGVVIGGDQNRVVGL